MEHQVQKSFDCIECGENQVSVYADSEKCRECRETTIEDEVKNMGYNI
jgi:hypothetical protein